MNAIESTEFVDYQHALAARGDAAHRLFEAELALHDAHQTHIAEWIRAAGDRLHDAVERHVAAEERVNRLDLAACTALAPAS